MALVVPVLLSLALLPLRGHVSDVLIALVLLTVSAAAVARGELLLSLVAATSTALSFDYFFTVPYDQLAIRGAPGVVTMVALIAAVPALGTWIGRLHGKQAARERELREKAERYAEELASLRRVATLVARATVPEEVSAAAAEEVGRLFAVDLATMSRHDSDRTLTFVASWGSAGELFPVGSQAVLGGTTSARSCSKPIVRSGSTTTPTAPRACKEPAYVRRASARRSGHRSSSRAGCGA